MKKPEAKNLAGLSLERVAANAATWHIQIMRIR
jgi:hypothetical protein